MQSSREKSCSQPVNLPGARPLMNPLTYSGSDMVMHDPPPGMTSGIYIYFFLGGLPIFSNGI